MSILRITPKRTAAVVFLATGLLLLLANAAHTQEPEILTDLDGLEGVNTDFVRAYDLVSTRQAWESIRQELSVQERTPQLVRVGIVDTGIDAQHEEFNDVRINSFTSRDLIDPKYKSTCRPPIKGHGTQVAGIIGAGNLVDNPAAHQEGQMNGMLSGALAEGQYILESRSYLSDVGLENTPATYFDSRFWVRNVVRAGSQVVNFSSSTTSRVFAPNDPCAVEHGEFLKATRAWIELFKRYQEIERFNRVVFVASAGNSGVNSLAAAPANAVVLDSVLFDGLELENVIVAGAVDLEKNRAIFLRNEDGTEKLGSNFGSGVHVAAPGTDVYTPTPIGLGDFPPDGPLAESYTTRFGGTSSAAPFVTGVVGLIKALEPNAGTDNALTPVQIQDILVSTGTQIDTDKPIGPLLNAHRAVCHPLVLNCTTTITIEKTVINNDGGAADPSDFSFTLDGTPILPGVATDVTPGTYTLSEIPFPGYTALQWGGNCNADGTIVVALDDPAFNDGFTCTITNDDTEPPSVNEWTELTPAAPLPPTRGRFAAVWDPIREQMLIFGGSIGSGIIQRRDDLWSYSPSTNTWSELQPVGARPSGRSGTHAIWDTLNDRMLLYGGESATQRLNDLWSYDPSINQWTLLTPGGTIPPARALGGVAWNPEANQMLIFGGITTIPSNDLWTYDSALNTWEERTPTGGPPPARWEPAAVWNPMMSRMELLLFSGCCGTLVDLWAYDPSANTWTELMPQGDPPLSRQGAASVWDATNEKMLLFGGFVLESPSGESNDLWAYDPEENTWEELLPLAPLPPTRYGAKAIWDPVGSRMMVHGGFTRQGTQTITRNDLWVYRP